MAWRWGCLTIWPYTSPTTRAAVPDATRGSINARLLDDGRYECDKCRCDCIAYCSSSIIVVGDRGLGGQALAVVDAPLFTKVIAQGVDVLLKRQVLAD